MMTATAGASLALVLCGAAGAQVQQGRVNFEVASIPDLP
jgi:hypothetical protein